MRRVRTLSCPLLVILIATAIFGVSCTSSPPEPEPARIVDEEARDRMPEDGHQALEWLLEGNRRFAEGRPRHDFESQRRRMMLTEGQHPFGVILGCSDSRVPPELIFDFGLGDLFVIRVAGNVVADDEAASIEYAIVHLDVPLVLVVGHEGCGAVTAALGAAEGEAKELQGLLKQIHPAVADIDPSLPDEEKIHMGVEANVRQSVRKLLEIAERESLPDDESRVHLGVEANVRQSVRKLLEIAERESLPDDERALVVGAVYELDTGLVRVLDE